jgi:hypothetical protein
MCERSLEIEYTVKVKYSFEEGTPFCKESAKENLLAAIENERKNNALTPCDISADWVAIEEVKQDPNAFVILDVNMSDIIGDYDVPEDSEEWSWVEDNASFKHRDNGDSGIWDFMLNIAMEHTDIPQQLVPVINNAISKGYTYILFNQGT